MNPRQRKGLLFMAVALLVAVGTFFAVSLYVSSVNSQVGQRVIVYQADGQIDPYTPLSEENLTPVEVPQRWVSETEIVDLSQLDGRRIAFAVSSGTTISTDMLIPSSELSSTEREIALNVNPVTGIGGRVEPGDRVDIYAVFGDVPGLPKQVRVLERNVRVVSVAGQQTVTQQTADGLTEADVIPVTLAVEPQAALSVTYAASFAQEVRLVGLPTDVGVERGEEPEQFDATDLGGDAIPEEQ